MQSISFKIYIIKLYSVNEVISSIYNLRTYQATLFSRKPMSAYFKNNLPICSSIAPTRIWSSTQAGQPGDNDLIIIQFNTNPVDQKDLLFQHQLLLPIITGDMFICNHYILNIMGVSHYLLQTKNLI